MFFSIDINNNKKYNNNERSDLMNIRQLRKSLKLTQSELAVKCGVSLTTIQLWERGVSQPKEENLIKLRQALKVDESNGEK